MKPKQKCKENCIALIRFYYSYDVERRIAVDVYGTSSRVPVCNGCIVANG